MNNCYFIGQIVEDLELNSDNGCYVCDFVIEVEEKWTNKSNKTQVIKTELNCTAWDKGAEALVNKFRKNDLIFVEGCIRHDEEGIDYIRVQNFRKVS
jgi:single-stranded DNA-binding protein